MQPENLNVGVVAQPEESKKDRSSLITIIVLATMVVFSSILNIVLALNGKKADTSGAVAFNNPVVENADGTWAEYFESSRVFVSGGTKTATFILSGGEVTKCAVQGLVETPTEDGKGAMVTGSEVECIVDGITGDVYKIVEFGKGSSPEEFYIGFITTDGSVYYVKTVEAITNNDFIMKGQVNVGGYVVDVIKVDVLPTDDNPAGGLSSVFVMRDGSLVEFDSSMLK